jgi:hypothetical protein
MAQNMADDWLDTFRIPNDEPKQRTKRVSIPRPSPGPGPAPEPATRDDDQGAVVLPFQAPDQDPVKPAYRYADDVTQDPAYRPDPCPGCRGHFHIPQPADPFTRWCPTCGHRWA